MFKPSAITNEQVLTIVGVDMAKATAKFEKDDKQLLQMGKFKLDSKSFKLSLDGELTTNGIAENKWTNPTTAKTTTTFSIGIALSDEDLEFFENQVNFLGSFVAAENEEYELTPLVKNDVIYLKVKDKKVFNAMANVKGDTLFHGQKVNVLVEFKFYINLKDLKAGLVLQPVKYVFETATD